MVLGGRVTIQPMNVLVTIISHLLKWKKKWLFIKKEKPGMMVDACNPYSGG